MMCERWAGLCVAALLLSGCATDKVGTDYAATPQRIGPPPAGQCRPVGPTEEGPSFPRDRL
jgi:hypothetical protein